MSTLGEIRVRTSFNTTNSDLVSKFKNESAKLIDILEEIRISPKLNNKDEFYTNDKEAQRLISLTQTAYEEAAMWAVKAITA